MPLATSGREGYVFTTGTGRRFNASNVRNRVLAPALANERLIERQAEPLPKLAPHSLRRTFASLLYALGENPPYVMAQLGHTTPNLALRLYAKAMDRRDGEPARLARLTGYRVTTGDCVRPDAESMPFEWRAAA